MASAVQLYKMNINEVEAYGEEYFKTHFPARYERAMDFRFPEDRLRSLGAGILLYETLGLEDDDIKKGQKGKPYSPDSKLHFNISHSGKYVVLAVSEKEVGVDIERIDRGEKTGKSLIDRVFTKEERTWLDAKTDERAGFVELWTLKESVVKALGCGLSLPLNSFSVLPLTRGESIQVNDRKLMGMTEFFEGYGLSSAYCD